MADEDGWVEGHREGYKKGRDDGIGIGYADAKLRAFKAVDALEESHWVAKRAIAEMRTALATTLGPRPG